MYNIKIESKKQKEFTSLDEEDETVSEAIETIYESYKPDVKITYKNYILYLSKKGDISDIFDGIIEVLSEIEKGKDQVSYNYLSSSFTVKMDIKIEQGCLIIQPTWYVANIEKDGCKIISEDFHLINKEIRISKVSFLNEWNKLLLEIKHDLTKAGYNNQLNGFNYLNNLNP